MSNKVPYTLSEDSITVLWEGKPYSVRSDNANFSALRKALFEARYEDVGQYLDLKKAVEDFVDGDVEIKIEVVYYKGFRLAGVVVDKLLDMLRSGMKDSSPLVNYIKRLMENPSSNSIEELYTFLGYKSLPITPDGKILGYKGVQDNFYSSTGNADTVVVQGTTNERHQIFNGVGETIEVQRRCVDDNKDNHCSWGLHIGSFDYADGWSGCDGKLLLVEFDPQDAVSVPSDCSFQKLRVCKYTVVADLTDCKRELNKAVYEYNKPVYNDPVDDSEDDDEDYCDEDYCDEEDDVESDFDVEDVIAEENEDDYDDEDIINLGIRNYIENKHEGGVHPTVKNVSGIKVCRDAELRCKYIPEVVQGLGFVVEENEDKVLSGLCILPFDCLANQVPMSPLPAEDGEGEFDGDGEEVTLPEGYEANNYANDRA